MINRILMELYDDYSKGNTDSLIDFTDKTLPHNGTDKLFIGCVLIMFSKASGFKPRYNCTRENLLDIVYAAKESVGDTNLLCFYIDRVNTHKGINKYFKNVLHDDNLEKYADSIIKYLEQFKPNFIEDIKRNEDKINDYLKKING